MSHPLLRTLISEMVEFYLSESDDTKPVHGVIDYMPDHNKKPSRNEIHSYLHKHGGDSIKIKKVTHDGPGGGASEVEFHGHPAHVMKLINHHHDENYSLNHAGHKAYEKDYN